MTALMAGCGSSTNDAGSVVATAASTSSASALTTSASTSAPSSTSSSTVPTSSTTSSAASSSAAQVPGITLAQGADALTDGLTVGASVGGGEHLRMLVDTGSNGAVVSRRYVGSGVTSLNPVQKFTGFTYSSSGNTYNGEWMTTTIQFGDATGTDYLATTVPITVRVVDEACIADKCSSDEGDIAVAMLGVGFDRGGDNPQQAAMGGPAINPFLNLEPMASGAMPQAYIMSADKIVLGPSAGDLTGFETAALTKTTPAAGIAVDWSAAGSCIAVPSGGVAAQCGTLLLDTGLGYAIVQAPTGVEPPVSAAAAGQRPLVENGQQVDITVTGLDKPIYSFTVGAAGAPQKVEWGHDLHDGQSFMNISRYALSQVDYLYDAATGRVGFRART